MSFWRTVPWTPIEKKRKVIPACHYPVFTCFKVTLKFRGREASKHHTRKYRLCYFTKEFALLSSSPALILQKMLNINSHWQLSLQNQQTIRDFSWALFTSLLYYCTDFLQGKLDFEWRLEWWGWAPSEQVASLILINYSLFLVRWTFSRNERCKKPRHVPGTTRAGQSVLMWEECSSVYTGAVELVPLCSVLLCGGAELVLPVLPYRQAGRCIHTEYN